jgi:hypothetical protein
MNDPFTLAAIAATFLLAGAVKGVIGLGLPTVSLALLATTLGLTEAMAVLLAPSFVTNVWQALVGGNGRAILKRLWPFLLTATITVWIGALALARVDIWILSALLGFLLVLYAAISLLGTRFSLSRRSEVWAAPLLGSINGVLTGMTGTFVVPGVLYLQAIGLARDQLVQAMGMLFTVLTLALALALGGNGLLGGKIGIISLAAIAPALVGMAIGRRVRQHLSETVFRRVFFMSLMALGLYIAAAAIAGV